MSEKESLYFVDVEIEGVSGTNRFGPVSTAEKADDLLVVLASRPNVKKATRVDQEN